MEILLCLSISLLAGLLLSRLAKLLQLPAVTAYLVAGILVGPFVLGKLGVAGLGFVNKEAIESVSILSDVALGFIAFSIGNEFRLPQLKKIGKQATTVGILQAVITTLLVDAALIALHFILGEEKFPLSAAIILGAIASATAPAATLMVVKQYKAKGPLTDILLPVVALDDAVGLILFAISFGVAKAIAGGAISVISLLVNPLLEIVCSLALGAAMGFLFSFCERFFHSRAKRLSISVAFVLFTVAISMIKFEVGGIHFGF
jgi:Kef-type K+ transport system membrane component KefB